MVFLSQPRRTPRLYWLVPPGGSMKPDLSRIAGSGAGVAMQESDAQMLSPMPLPCLKLDRGLTCARIEGARDGSRKLLQCSLPSDVAACRGETTAPIAVMLDIVLGETTEDAWAETERLIEEGLPARTAASALVGTAQDIAHRIENYRALGVTDIVLSAPPERAPYEAVQRTLLPLLGRVRDTLPEPAFLTGSATPAALTADAPLPN